MSKLEVKHLTKIFGRKTHQALNMIIENKSKKEILAKTGATVGVYDANFQVNEGEIFVVMGLSGSGKSTLIRLLNRLIEPTDGQIFIDGQDIAKLDKEGLREVRRHKINMVFQSFGLFPHRTILENVEYGLEIKGVTKEEREKSPGTQTVPADSCRIFCCGVPLSGTWRTDAIRTGTGILQPGGVLHFHPCRRRRYPVGHRRYLYRHCL